MYLSSKYNNIPSVLSVVEASAFSWDVILTKWQGWNTSVSVFMVSSDLNMCSKLQQGLFLYLSNAQCFTVYHIADGMGAWYTEFVINSVWHQIYKAWQLLTISRKQLINPHNLFNSSSLAQQELRLHILHNYDLSDLWADWGTTSFF